MPRRRLTAHAVFGQNGLPWEESISPTREGALTFVMRRIPIDSHNNVTIRPVAIVWVDTCPNADEFRTTKKKG